MQAPKPINEEERLAALGRYEILDTPDEAAFDDITRLIACLCDAPVAVINLVDRDRQWFKSEIGLGVRQTPLDISLCAHALLQPDLLVVPDTLADLRFADNPLVTRDDSPLRFYAGALLQTHDGHALGTLCVLDYVPRTLTPPQTEALRVLAGQVMTQIELRSVVAEQVRVIAQKNHVEAELARLYLREKRIAETLQRSLLVMPRADAFSGLLVHSFYEPAWTEANVGGDFCDAFSLAGGKVALVVGDASGKGLQAAARTAEVKHLVRAFLRETNGDPCEALARLNETLCEAHRLDAQSPGEEGGVPFVCVAMTVVDAGRRSLVYTGAGMEPPLLLSLGDQGEEIIEIESFNLPLGVQSGAVFAAARPQAMAPGDTLVLFTDGLSEARQNGRLLGHDGLTALLAQQTSAVRAGDLGAVGQAIFNGARAWAGGALSDDACLLLARCGGDAGNA